MNIENALINKVITTGDLPGVVSKGILLEHFADPACQDMFKYLLDHSRKYKSTPSIAAIKNDRPGWEIVNTSDRLDYLVDKFISLVKRRYAQNALTDLARITEDPKQADNLDASFLEVSRTLAQIVPHTRTAHMKDMSGRISSYKEHKEEGVPLGLPFGYPYLDERTGGVQRHELVTVAGFSGLGKSTFLISVAFNFWTQGFTPLYISLEMEAQAILRKFDAMAAGLDYAALKKMNLSEEQIANWEKTAQKIAESSQDIPIIDDIRGCTPDHIFAETVRHDPDVVIVDYIGLMRSQRANRNNALWQNLTEITQDLKQNARTLRIPIIAAAQTNRSGHKDGAELDNIGGSISVIQDADIVLGLFADDELKAAKQMEIRINKNRDGSLGKFIANWDHERMYFKELEHHEKFGAVGPKFARE